MRYYSVQEAKWITLGAQAKKPGTKGANGKKHGGVAVLIGDDGVILKGPAHMKGKKPDELGGRQKTLGEKPGEKQEPRKYQNLAFGPDGEIAEPDAPKSPPPGTGYADLRAAAAQPAPEPTPAPTPAPAKPVKVPKVAKVAKPEPVAAPTPEPKAEKGETVRAKIARIKAEKEKRYNDTLKKRGKKEADKQKADDKRQAKAEKDALNPAQAEARKKKQVERISKINAARPESLISLVRKEGGISGGDYDYATDIKEFGLKSAMNKRGLKLDDMAKALQNAGHIVVPEGKKAEDVLLAGLQTRANSALHNHTGRYDSEYDDFINSREDADNAPGADSDRTASVISRGEEAGTDQGDDDSLAQILGFEPSRSDADEPEPSDYGHPDDYEPSDYEPEEGDLGDGGEITGADTSFDFGAPEPEPVKAPAPSPEPTPAPAAARPQARPEPEPEPESASFSPDDTLHLTGPSGEKTSVNYRGMNNGKAIVVGKSGMQFGVDPAKLTKAPLSDEETAKNTRRKNSYLDDANEQGDGPEAFWDDQKDDPNFTKHFGHSKSQFLQAYNEKNSYTATPKAEPAPEPTPATAPEPGTGYDDLRAAAAKDPEVSTITPEPSAASPRDLEKSEQRTPDEHAKGELLGNRSIFGGLKRTKAEAKEVLAKRIQQILDSPGMSKVATDFGLTPEQTYTTAKINGKWAVIPSHASDVATATYRGNPVSAEAVEKYGIILPKNYTKQGEIYVAEPSQPEEPEQPKPPEPKKKKPPTQKTKGLTDDPEKFQQGDRFKGENGEEFQVFASRQGALTAHPVVDGKPQINKSTEKKFAITDAAAAANPTHRRDFVPGFDQSQPGRDSEEIAQDRARLAKTPPPSPGEGFADLRAAAKEPEATPPESTPPAPEAPATPEAPTSLKVTKGIGYHRQGKTAAPAYLAKISGTHNGKTFNREFQDGDEDTEAKQAAYRKKKGTYSETHDINDGELYEHSQDGDRKLFAVLPSADGKKRREKVSYEMPEISEASRIMGKTKGGASAGTGRGEDIDIPELLAHQHKMALKAGSYKGLTLPDVARDLMASRGGQGEPEPTATPEPAPALTQAPAPGTGFADLRAAAAAEPEKTPAPVTSPPMTKTHFSNMAKGSAFSQTVKDLTALGAVFHKPSATWSVPTGKITDEVAARMKIKPSRMSNMMQLADDLMAGGQSEREAQQLAQQAFQGKDDTGR